MRGAVVSTCMRGRHTGEVGEGMHACWSIPVRNACWATYENVREWARTRDANSNQYALSIQSACNQDAPAECE